MNRSTVLLSVAALTAATAPLTAQRESADLKIAKKAVTVDYGAVRVGKHSLDALQVGGEWRMGMNQASTLHTELPLVAGTALVPPGSYRVKIHRRSDQDLLLRVEGAGLPLDKDPDAFLPGKLDEPKGKRPKALEVSWSLEKSKSAVKDAMLIVDFGKDRLDIHVDVVSPASGKIKLKGFDVTAFAFPVDVLEARMEKGLMTPVATLAKKGKPKKGEPSGYNLVVGKDGARLVPVMTAPTDSFGFGNVVAPAAAHTHAGEIEWAEGQEAKPAKTASLELKLTKGTLTGTLVAGEKRAALTIAMSK